MGPAVVTPAALGAELQAVSWRPVLGAAAAAVTLLVLDLTAWPRGPGAVTAWLGAALLAGSAAFAMDQPAAGIVRSAPTSAAWRIVVRAAPGVAALAVWAAYAVLWRSRTEVAAPTWWAQLLVGSALLLLGAGVCATLVRREQVEPAAAVAGALVFAVLALGLVPLPGDVQALDLSGTRGSTTAFWLAVGAVGAAGLVWGSRDDGSRWRGPRTGPARRS
ncbi:hypothetical protein ACOCJ4_01015 [Knoellia sp. CPCC 206435]|uniref:hypothetical protein n=1 Tax=Knoellia terrae TaxID=3404797 RepID=UPI003B42ADFE